MGLETATWLLRCREMGEGRMMETGEGGAVLVQDSLDCSVTTVRLADRRWS